MGQYRQTRNIEASVIDYLTKVFNQGGWSNIIIEKTFTRIYGVQVDSNAQVAAICVRVLSSKHNKAEIGDNATWRDALIMLDIFATSDGQREDLKDFVISHIKHGVPYYQYNISEAKVATKIQKGRLRILSIEDNPVNFNIDKSQLAVLDRYRHVLAINMSTGQIEG